GTERGKKRERAEALSFRSWDGPSNHIVNCRRLADVLDVVLLVGRLKDDAPRANAARLAALKRLERSLFDDQQLFMRMLVWRVRRLARIERRDVYLEL